MKSLKKILFGDKVPLPSIVKKRAGEYKKDEERINHFFCKIELDEQYYYCIEYLPSSDGIIITEDGAVPPLSEVSEPRFEDPIWLSRITDMLAMSITKTGKKWAKSTTFFHRRVLQLLDKIAVSFPRMPPHIKKAYDSFHKTSQTFIEKQKSVEESYREGKKIDNQLFETHIVTKELNYKLNLHQSNMVKGAYWQNYIQMV